MGIDCLLLTGATGFIGSHAAKKLVDVGSFQVISIVPRVHGYKNTDELRNRGVLLEQGDFYDSATLKRVFDQYSVRYVVHLAAIRGAGVGKWHEYNKVNVIGTEALYRAALRNGVKKFIFFSTVGVYGTIPNTLPADLDTELIGDTLYHHSKIVAERKLWDTASNGMDIVIIRPAITYGRGDNGFPKVLVELVRKRLLLLPSQDIKVHLLDVDSLTTLILQVLKTECPAACTVIAADKSAVSLHELVDSIHFYHYGKKYPPWLKLPISAFRISLKVFQSIGKEKWATRMSLLSDNWYYDIKKTIEVFSFKPSETIPTFLRAMCRPASISK